MILRHIDVTAPPSPAAAQAAVHAFPDVSMIQQPSHSTMMIEGPAEAITALLEKLPGWSAFPLVKYDRPATRQRVDKPARR
jgi:hypothetical protein